MFGGAGSDFLLGAAGDDLLRGGDRSDNMAGGYGDDRVFGEAGDDYLTDTDIWGPGPGTPPDLTIPGDTDLLSGGPGDDSIGVQSGPDRVFGGLGDDEIKVFGDDGAVDRVRCGDGNDVVVYFYARDDADLVAEDCERVVVED